MTHRKSGKNLYLVKVYEGKRLSSAKIESLHSDTDAFLYGDGMTGYYERKDKRDLKVRIYRLYTLSNKQKLVYNG